MAPLPAMRRPKDGGSRVKGGQWEGVAASALGAPHARGVWLGARLCCLRRGPPRHLPVGADGACLRQTAAPASWHRFPGA